MNKIKESLGNYKKALKEETFETLLFTTITVVCVEVVVFIGVAVYDSHKTEKEGKYVEEVYNTSEFIVRDKGEQVSRRNSYFVEEDKELKYVTVVEDKEESKLFNRQYKITEKVIEEGDTTYIQRYYKSMDKDPESKVIPMPIPVHIN